MAHLQGSLQIQEVSSRGLKAFHLRLPEGTQLLTHYIPIAFYLVVVGKKQKQLGRCHFQLFRLPAELQVAQKE